MTTDPPPGDFEDVKIGNWEGCLPTGMCTNREIFKEVFSLETWKTVLEPEQRERIMVSKGFSKTPSLVDEKQLYWRE